VTTSKERHPRLWGIKIIALQQTTGQSHRKQEILTVGCYNPYQNILPYTVSDLSVRYLMVAEDDTLFLVENGTVVWTREEGLASVQDSLFLDLPVATPELEPKFNAEKPTLKDRAYAEFLTIKVLFT